MNNVFLEIGPITIYWYSICILIAFVLGYFLATREFKRQNLSLSFLSDYFFYLVPIVIIGARLYYVIFEWEYYSQHLADIIKVWNGGLAIHGGVFAGIIFTIYYTKKHKIDPLKMMDIAAPCLIIGQAIGRWGNFFNQEAYGPATDLLTLENLCLPQFVIDGMNINGVYHHPTFFYESMACLLGFIIMLIVRRYKNLKVGHISALYFIIYGITRFFIESMRQDSLMLGSFKVAQLVSLGLVIIGALLFIKQMYSNKLYNSKEK
jgi:phosphatidylglycerol:prolipoprotein diacylglycerol transferase